MIAGNNSPFLWRLAYQRLGFCLQKYHAESIFRQSIFQTRSPKSDRNRSFPPVSAQISPNELSCGFGGQPIITRNTSNTKSAIAMSL